VLGLAETIILDSRPRKLGNYQHGGRLPETPGAPDLLRHCLEEGEVVSPQHFREELANEAITSRTLRSFDEPELDISLRSFRLNRGAGPEMARKKTMSQHGRKPVRKIERTSCGVAARVVRGSYDFVESGLKRVRLQSIELIVCDQCGNVDPIIPRVNDLIRLLVVAVIAKPYRLAGDEIRFLRKYLCTTGDESGRLLHINRANLSKWENNEDRVGAQSDRLIRTIALGLGEGLKGKLEELIRKFPEIQDEPAA